MVFEEVTVAESPENTDNGKTGIVCRLNVYIAVAYIDRRCLVDPQLSQCLVHRVGSWFLSYALVLMFPDGNLYLREEVADKLLCCRHELVAYHR